MRSSNQRSKEIRRPRRTIDAHEAKLCLDVSPLGTSRLGTGGTFAVIGFLQFALRLGHDVLVLKSRQKVVSRLTLAGGWGNTTPDRPFHGLIRAFKTDSTPDA